MLVVVFTFAPLVWRFGTLGEGEGEGWGGVGY